MFETDVVTPLGYALKATGICRDWTGPDRSKPSAAANRIEADIAPRCEADIAPSCEADITPSCDPDIAPRCDPE